MTFEELRSSLEQGEVSVKRLADLINVSYAGLVRVMRKPILGKAYNPDEVNFEELKNFFERNNVKLDEIVMEDIKQVKKSKKETVSVNCGEIVTLGTEKAQWMVVYKTEKMVCLQLGEELRSMSYQRLSSLLSD